MTMNVSAIGKNAKTQLFVSMGAKIYIGMPNGRSARIVYGQYNTIILFVGMVCCKNESFYYSRYAVQAELYVADL